MDWHSSLVHCAKTGDWRVTILPAVVGLFWVGIGAHELGTTTDILLRGALGMLVKEEEYWFKPWLSSWRFLQDVSTFVAGFLLLFCYRRALYWFLAGIVLFTLSSAVDYYYFGTGYAISSQLPGRLLADLLLLVPPALTCVYIAWLKGRGFLR